MKNRHHNYVAIKEYFGLQIPVTDKTNYLATDANGYVYGFQDEPSVDSKHNVWHSDGYHAFLHQVVFCNEDWKNTLVKL